MLTHLRHRAAPLLRFRTRDHVEVRMSPCPCGRTGPRVRCIGRTDDMLIVRGVNVFPSASARSSAASRPRSSGHILVRPRGAGRQAGAAAPGRASSSRADAERATRRWPRRSAQRLRDVLVVQTRVELVPWGSLQRSEYKSKLVER